MDDQQGPTEQHRGLCYVAAWMGEEFGEKGYVNSMIDSVCCLHLKLSQHY